MIKFLKFSMLSFLFLQLAACAGLANMKKVEYADSAKSNMALVNIVRPSVFVGDGAKAEAWDGEKLVGTLESGTMIQYETEPGEHTFMVYTQGSWGVAKGSVMAGKKYYLKYNVGFGFITLGVADATDTRIEVWNKKLTPMAVDRSSEKAVPEKYKKAAREILEKVKNGTAKYETISEVNAI